MGIDTYTDAKTGQVVTREVPDMTPEELTAVQERRVSRVLSQMDNDLNILKALAAVLFEVTNEVRVLKGQSALSPVQFRNYVKSKL